MLTRKKRTVHLFIVATIMNLCLFLIAYFLKLPLWLDTTGTIYITLFFGFPAGFLIGLINNTILSLFFYGFDSIVYYLVSIAVALTAHICIKRSKGIGIKLAFTLILFIFIVSIFFVIPLTFRVDNGVPSDYWGHLLYEIMIQNHFISVWATILAVVGIKLLDVIITITIVMSAYKLTPSKLKDSSHVIQ